MIVDGEKRHYTVIKSVSRLRKSLNATQKGRTGSASDKHYDYCSSNGHVKVKMPTEKEKCLTFHDGQSPFKVPFMLYGEFESILK